MVKIYVRTKIGRKAFEHLHGPPIPDDQFVAVEKTPQIERLLNFHKDIEEKATTHDHVGSTSHHATDKNQDNKGKMKNG